MLAIGSLSACVPISSDPIDASATGASSATSTEELPSFSGPYREEFERIWRESESDFVRSVIADQQISDDEWAEVETRISTCLGELGMTFQRFNADGSYDVDIGSFDGQQANDDALPKCETESGERWIGRLRRELVANPDNIPPEVAITECMIRNGVVSGDYTSEQYLEDVPQRSFPYLDPSMGNDGHRQCTIDPSATFD